MSFGERVFSALIRLYPRAFRDRYRDDLLAFFRQDRDHPKYGAGPLRPVRFWTATLRDAVRTARSHRWAARQEARAIMAGSPRTASALARWRVDVRFAWRGLWAAPGVTLAALTVLVIGIGASTAIFSVVDAVMLRGLPFRDAGSILSIAAADNGRPLPFTPQDFFDLRARQRTFDTLGATVSQIPLTTTEEPVEKIQTVRATASLFDLLGAAPARGRAFAAADEQPGAPRVALISDRLWRRRFNASPDVVGRTVAFDSGAVTIIGVMKPEFAYPIRQPALAVDIWLAYVPAATDLFRAKTRNYSVAVVGRLKPGVTLEQASADLTRVRDGIAAEYPDWIGELTVLVRRLQDAVVGSSVQSWMLLLLSAVAGVLLIACLNVANLLVARAISRAPELAVRTALGASRWDLARASIIESVMLSLIGAAGGILLAILGVDLLRSNLPGNVPRLATVAVDLRVMLVAVSAAVVTGIVFGVLPALQVARADLVTLVGQGGRSQSAGRTSRRIRTGLMVAEVAVAAVLVAGSGLFLSSFARVATIDLGFDPRHVVAFFGSVMSSSALTPATKPEAQLAAASGQSMAAAALERIRAVPGVIAAEAMQGGRPLSRSWVGGDVQHADLQSKPFTGPDAAKVRSVGPQYLNVIRGRLTKGRWIAAGDVTGATPVVVLGEEAARRYFGSRDPVGQTILIQDYARQIIGVATAMRWDGPENAINPEVYIPFAQTSHDRAEIMVRTAAEPATLMPAIKQAIRAAMPDATASEPSYLEQSYADLLAQRKFNMIVLTIFGIVAIAVAAVGIYGLMAFVVAQRRREIGVRVALGAAPMGILRMILRSATTLMAVGLAIGIGAALLLEQTVRSFLFNAQPHDPVIYGVVAVVLFLAGLVAAFGPARRAARVDPLVALRID